MRRASGGKRVVILALSSLGCGLLTGLLVLYIDGKSLTPSDEAYGMSVVESLADPLVLLVWLPFTLGSASLGFVYSLVALRNVNLAKAIPLVAVVTVGAAAATATSFAPASPFVALLVALLVALIAMEFCRNWSPWASNEPPPESGFREAIGRHRP